MLDTNNGLIVATWRYKNVIRTIDIATISYLEGTRRQKLRKCKYVYY